MRSRKVGGAIKKPKTPKIFLKEEKEEEDKNEGEKNNIKSKDPVKTKPISKKKGKAEA